MRALWRGVLTRMVLGICVCLSMILPAAMAETGQHQAPIMIETATPQSMVPLNPVIQDMAAPSAGSPEASVPPGFVPQVFKLKARKDLFLPNAMYGVWSIRATIIESNADPYLYRQEDQLIWSLAKDQQVITLQNLRNKATAYVNVDMVQGNTAKFHHQARSGPVMVIETPTLTVQDDHLFGVSDKLVFIYDHHNRLRANYKLVVKVDGYRLSGNRVTFGEPDKPKPDFTVDPLLHD